MKIPESSPDVMSLLAKGGAEKILQNPLSAVDDKGRYLHWEEVRRRTPPQGLTVEQWWTGMWISRRGNSVLLPLTDTNGRPFRFSNIGPIQAAVHRIDLRLGGHILADKRRVGEGLGGHRVASLVEEAITSSQLEGAATTRPVAKEMLRTGRKPRNHSERMILNNYLGMQEVMGMAENDFSLSVEAICSLHRVLTRGTLEDEQDEGRPQKPGEERVGVFWPNRNQALHLPPAASELPDRLETLCQFANNGTWATPIDTFLHPLVKAIVLHFWLAHDHPFTDGNGRTARALFYWSILRAKYELAPYTSISSILRKAPAQYAKSFLHVYTDDNDLTYFVIHQLKTLERAIEALNDYIERKRAEMADLYRTLSACPQLNHRQQDTVIEAVRNPQPVTIAAHSRYHRVANQSARTDLLELAKLGLFEKAKVGKRFLFSPVPNLQKRLSQLVYDASASKS